MSREPTPEEWEVFAEYGWTMLSVQEFEFSLSAAVESKIEDLDTNKSTSIDDLFLRIGKLFRLTAGQMKMKLAKESNMPEELLEDVVEAIALRNVLAHEFLRRRLSTWPTAPPNYQEIVAELKNFRAAFKALERRIFAWLRAEGAGDI